MISVGVGLGAAVVLRGLSRIRGPVRLLPPQSHARRHRRVIVRVGFRAAGIVGKEPSEAQAAVIGQCVLAGLVVSVIDLRLSLVAVLAPWVRSIATRRRARVDRLEAVVESLPEVVDVLRVAADSGLSVAQSVSAVGNHVHGPIADSLRRAAQRSKRGAALADELQQAGSELGEAVQPLIRVLVTALRYGLPVSDSLERIAGDVRLQRRRLAEIRARRVPIRLLFPLVLCVLPAFGLLTVVPVLVDSIDSLRR